MKDNYLRAVNLLFKLEGYKSNVQGDPGHLTIWGITETYYPDIVKKMIPMSPTMAMECAIQFYKHEFWDAHKLNDVPYPLDIIAFCMIVNSHKEGELLLNSVILDIHPVETDWRNYLYNFLCFYIDLWKKDKTREKFLYGWKNRTKILWDMFNNVQ